MGSEFAALDSNEHGPLGLDHVVRFDTAALLRLLPFTTLHPLDACVNILGVQLEQLESGERFVNKMILIAQLQEQLVADFLVVPTDQKSQRLPLNFSALLFHAQLNGLKFVSFEAGVFHFLKALLAHTPEVEFVDGSAPTEFDETAAL